LDYATKVSQEVNRKWPSAIGTRWYNF